MQEIKRKLIHFSSIWTLFALHYLDFNNFKLIICVIGLLVLFLDFLRIYNLKFKNLMMIFFQNIMRKHEIENKLTGASYFMLSICFCSFLASKPLLMLAISILIFSDSFAALIGRKYGDTKIFDKSAEGFIAFTLVGIIISAVIKYMYNLNNIWFFSASFATIIAGIIELCSVKIKIDDNLTIPLSVVTVMSILGHF